MEAIPLPPGTELRVEQRLFRFRKPARTSRGALSERPVWFIHADTPWGTATGECSPMPALSPESKLDNLENTLWELCAQVKARGALMPHMATEWPACRLALEGAILQASCPGTPLWDTPFSRGEKGVEIHHLIWMADAATMLHAMQEGVRHGFRCLKMKVGALPFPQEVALLQEAHRRFPGIELRVDANGAFAPEDVLSKLQQLADAGVSCIEQPLPPGSTAAMHLLCRQTPLPIALDEELIPHHSMADKERLLETIAPQAIVIKPTLHGGLQGTQEWARLATEHGIRWWINSALETPIGLSLLAQWCGRYAPDTLHGLSTGKLLEERFSTPIHLEGAQLFMRIPEKQPTKAATPFA